VQGKRVVLKPVRQAFSPSSDFGTVLNIINAHRAKALVSVNVEHLLTNWEIGGYLSANFAKLFAIYGNRIVQTAIGQLDTYRFVQPTAGQIVGPADVQPVAAQNELKARSFRPADMGQLEFYLEALDRDVKRANENPSVMARKAA